MALLIASENGFPELSAALVREGRRFEVCRLKDAVSQAKGPVEAVLLDSGLDVEKGLSLLKALKIIRPSIPVLFFTDISSEEIIAGAFRSGARDYFKKPVNIFELEEALNNLLSIREKGFFERRTVFFIREGRAPLSRHFPSGEGVQGWAEDGERPQSNGLPAYVFRAVNHLKKNFCCDVSLQKLAEEAGISKHHLCRAFKRYMGSTPMRFLAHLRIERAKELLRSSSLSVSTIGADAGFNDLGSFIKQFKKLTGFTPGEFKRKIADTESLRLF